MPRMSKSKKLEWSFFLNDRGRKAYNTLCRRCVHDCKQSFRAVAVICPHYQSKRAKKGWHSCVLPSRTRWNATMNTADTERK